MPDLSLLAVLVAAIAAFVSGGVYYAVLGEQLAAVSDAAAAGEQPPPWKLAVELLRCLIIAAVVAGLASQGEIDEWGGGLLLGLALWIGFPLVLWTGALIHENTPWKLAAIHACDWLVKLLVVAVIVTVWQQVCAAAGRSPGIRSKHSGSSARRRPLPKSSLTNGRAHNRGQPTR